MFNVGDDVITGPEVERELRRKAALALLLARVNKERESEHRARVKLLRESGGSPLEAAYLEGRADVLAQESFTLETIFS